MKILYITRKFPPSVGGMETAAYEMHASLQSLADVRIIKYGGANKYLPIVYPILLLRALFSGWLRRPDVIYLQDGMLAPMGVLLRVLVRRPCVVSVHGLDVTFPNKTYQKVMKFCFPKIDCVVAGGIQTETEVRNRHPLVKLKRVVYGCRDSFFIDRAQPALREQLAKELSLDTEQIAGKKIIVTTGRLVKRKGVSWFVREVMPTLAASQPHLTYLIAGDGPDKGEIQDAVNANGLRDKVFLLGYISSIARDLLYNSADIFLMPNLKVPGDMEGFGLVAVEAASCGTPVFASGIEGIVDAVAEGKTGRLLESQNPRSFIDAINDEISHSMFSRQNVREYVLDNFSWEQTAAGYMRIFEKLKIDHHDRTKQ
ncbi:glycosyltransferase family 4 protein [Candidatus Saccharibacteria bacterium]|nr:glycosyltransferase family 4 protein [Candidatus Saccharibacteria bacterium]